MLGIIRERCSPYACNVWRYAVQLLLRMLFSTIAFIRFFLPFPSDLVFVNLSVALMQVFSHCAGVGKYHANLGCMCPWQFASRIQGTLQAICKRCHFTRLRPSDSRSNPDRSNLVLRPVPYAQNSSWKLFRRMR